jgi:hypothetical protein
MIIPRSSYYVIAVCLLGTGLGGCATTTAMEKTHATIEKPIKVLIAQSPMRINPARLQKVFAPSSNRNLSISDEPIAKGVSHAQEFASEAMASSLAKQPNVIVVIPPASEQHYIDEMRDKHLAPTISQEVADGIIRTTGADALLKFQITDYGLTPRAWRTGYITFEVTSTLALAGVIAYAGSTVAKAAAGTYLVQEGIEETAESYAGFWALDVECRPVRIEAELVRLNPVKMVWSTSDTGLSDIRLSRLTSKVSPSELNNQLNQSIEYAVKDVVASLADTLGDFRAMDRNRTQIHPVGFHQAH